MNIFPGNVLIIDDQFNLGFVNEAPVEPTELVQWENFRKIRNLLDTHSLCYSTITDTSDISVIVEKIKSYSNIRMLILDLDLNESGEVDDIDVAMIKKIIDESINSFGYFLLAINSSYAEKWEEIKNELIQEYSALADEQSLKKINFLVHLSFSLSKSLPDIEADILSLITTKYSCELITQFEVNINNARDTVLNSFIEFNNTTWEELYLNLKADMDSKHVINLTINNLFIGLIKQHLIDKSYSTPDIDEQKKIEKIKKEANPILRKEIIIGFYYIVNKNGVLDNHPIWTGNLYYNNLDSPDSKYKLIITPECDIAQSKSSGITVIQGYEIDLKSDYDPAQFKDIDPPYCVMVAGKNGENKWKSKAKIIEYYESKEGFYIVPFSSINGNHIVLNLRNVVSISNLERINPKLILRVNEPIITDINDRFSAIYNRKGIPRLSPAKNYMRLI